MNSKITAFVLNELPENERAAFLAELENDSALQHEIRETQDFCDLLQQEIGTQNTPSLTEDQHAALASAFANPQPASDKQPSNVRRFPFRILAAGIGTLAAAYAIISQLPEQASQRLGTDTNMPQSSEHKAVNNIDKLLALGLAPQEPLVLAGAKKTGSGSGGGLAAPTTPVPVAPKLEFGNISGASELVASTLSDTRPAIPPPSPEPSARQNLPRPGSQQPIDAPSQSSKAAADSQMGYIKAEIKADAAPAGALAGLAGNTFVSAQPAPGVPAPAKQMLGGDFQSQAKIRALETDAESKKHAAESYRPIAENPFHYTDKEPLSTFSTDVDTASYSNVRRLLNQRVLPQPDAVRLEELINYFPYQYAAPKDGKPLGVSVAIAEAPWQPLHRLARIALKAREINAEKRNPANFVFLIDVSGSMNSPERLPLIKEGLLLLVDQLRPEDQVSIVTYAGECGVALESTPGSQKERIRAAVQSLEARGSTNGESGIRLAYEQAAIHFKKENINRVILCTDGDFNVGVSSPTELENLVAEKAKGGVFLSVLGVGVGNLRDHTMMAMADRGNGNYAYLDSSSEARKVLVEQMSGTLITVAKDVKIQVEFNPKQVAAYRLIGYEKRNLENRDFNDDKKDAGDVGAGHTVTALYEIVPAGLKFPDGKALVDDLKYNRESPVEPVSESNPNPAGTSAESMTIKVRYKQPDCETSALMEVPATDTGKKLSEQDSEFQFATSVAEFGMLLRGTQNVGQLNWDSVRELARKSKGEDANGYRGEFLRLIEQAASLRASRP